MDLTALQNKPRPNFSGIPPEELSARFSESKEQIAEETAPKKGRGRPKGSTNKHDAPATTENIAASMGPLLKPMLSMPFDVLAEQTGYEPWRLDTPSADMLSLQLEAVLKQYAPQVNGPYAAIVSFSVSLLFVAGTRYLGYQQALKNSQVKPKTTELPQ